MDAINPKYYTRYKIEPIDFIAANNLNFLVGSIIKYVMRYDQKGGLEDLHKAEFYLNWLMDDLVEKARVENER